jgi:uncharacterized protein (DUF2235 family)
MLQKVGLLPKGNEESIPLAYGLYKRAINVPMGLSSRSAARAFKQKFCRKVEVHFVGVFVSRGIRARAERLCSLSCGMCRTRCGQSAQ